MLSLAPSRPTVAVGALADLLTTFRRAMTHPARWPVYSPPARPEIDHT
jgi:hypothetical protein